MPAAVSCRRTACNNVVVVGRDVIRLTNETASASCDWLRGEGSSPR